MNCQKLSTVKKLLVEFLTCQENATRFLAQFVANLFGSLIAVTLSMSIHGIEWNRNHLEHFNKDTYFHFCCKK